jgi:hypothetical protein
MKLLRDLLSSLVALAIAGAAQATTHSTDYTDLWWNSPDASENGWGVNVVQQGDIVFATFFIFGADGTPRWYVASNLGSVGAPAGQNTFTGPLFATTGTHFALPWNPANRGFTQVGTATFNFTTELAGTLSYTIDGVQVVKNIKRQTWRTNNLAGRYFGGSTANGRNCGGGIPNGLLVIMGDMSVAHANLANIPSNLTMEVDFVGPQGQAATCSYTATYRQEGKMGSADGTFGCVIQGNPNAPFGTFSLREVQANPNGLIAKYTARDQYCEYTGFFGGPRRPL